MSTKTEKKGPSLPVKGYLVLYNLACAAGWAYNLSLLVQSYFAGETAIQAWSKSGPILTIVQTMAVLEIFHSIFKLVSSPWLTTFIQVMSRLIVLWGYTIPSSHQHWSFYLLAISWSTVEVPRYLFYVWQLLFPTTPAPLPLFWLRYSLFALLYPTGISGEILQLWNAMPYWKETLPLFRIISYVLLFSLYPPLSPFMYMHMVKQRKNQFKKRDEEAKGPAATPVKVEEGLLFPKDAQTGEVSTSITGKTIFAESIKPISQVAADVVLKERNWRFGYSKHVVDNAKASAQSKKDAITIARAGLDYCYKNFRFVRNGIESNLQDALTQYKDTFLEGKLVGKAAKTTQGVIVPYKGQKLQDAALKKQLDSWVEYGTIEPSCRDAIWWAHENVKDLSKSQAFVLLGAGSAMGPLQMLLSLNATIVAVDLDRPGIWERVLGMVENSGSTVYFPLKSKPASNSIKDLSAVAGCNIFTQTPEISRFIAEILPEKKLVIGTYVYLDSAAHVQVSLAADAVVKTAINARGVGNVIPAYLCSPTDVFSENKETFDAAQKNRKNAPLWQKIISMLPLGKKGLRKNGIEAGKDNYIVDGLVVDQGPNYALAKRIQHWRAVLTSGELNGMVSSNIAPSTATLSVVHNASFAMAYKGMASFKPMEVMQQETSNAVMGALLVHDIMNADKSPKNPTSAEGKKAGVAENPMLLFAQGAFHGGVWRNAFTMNSAGPFYFLVGALGKYWYAPLAIFGAIAGIATKGLPIDLP
jgi:hypothetical protein